MRRWAVVLPALLACACAVPTPTPRPPLAAAAAPTALPAVVLTSAPAPPPATAQPPPSSPTPPAAQTAPPTATARMARKAATVVRVVDGDTVRLRIDGREEPVRLIGLNTPETVAPNRPIECLGREASAKAKELLPVGTAVGVEDDPTQDTRDAFGRLLLYIWLPDGRLVNRELIALGYAHEFTYRLPYRYQAEFRAAQREAEADQRGLWARGACEGQPTAPTRAPVSNPPAVALPTATPRPTLAPAVPTARPIAPVATATPRPAPTATLVPQPTPATIGGANEVTIVRAPGTVSRGQRASVTARTAPNTACTIAVQYLSGPSRAQGLDPKSADGAGQVSWSWTVGTNTTAGRWPVTISCGGRSASTVVTVP